MGGKDFVLAVVAAAFLLAGWVDVKVGDTRRPESPAKRIVLCLVGVLVLQASVGGLSFIQAAGASRAGLTAAVLAVFLPALIFAFLTGLWLVRVLAEIAGPSRR